MMNLNLAKRGTILERIARADSDHEIRALVNEGNRVNTGTRRSGKTRRAWLRAAKKRRAELV